MDLRQLKTFSLVARNLSFTRAAASLGYVQSSVTSQIQALETDLGVPLFDRLGRRVVLTDAGERLLKYADQMLSLAEEARAALTAGDEPVGTLTMSAAETIYSYRLPSVLHQFRVLYPKVRLVFQPSAMADLRQRVVEGALDVAFILGEPVQQGDLAVEQLVRESVLVIAAPDNPLVERESVRAEDFAGETILFTEPGCNYRSLFERQLIAAGVHPTSSFEFASVETIKQCVMTGMGIAVLPAVAVASEIDQGRIVALRWVGEPMEVVTQMVWHGDRWRSPAFDAFLKTTRELLYPAV